MAKNKDELYELVEMEAKVADHVSDIPSLSELATELGWDKNTVRRWCEKMAEGEVEGMELNEIDTQTQARRFIPLYMDESQFQESLAVKREIRNAVKQFEDRILRKPKKSEISEELGVENTTDFRETFSRTVGDSWRSPSENQIEDARETLQDRVDDATFLFLFEDDNELKSAVDDEVKEYLNDNRDLFREFEFEPVETVPDEEEIPRRFKVKPPQKLSKFLKKPKFYIDVPDVQKEDESIGEYLERITRKYREEIK